MDRWVCPNDRQLALRAKLGTGWSVHTNKANAYRKDEHLSMDEQEQIMGVIQRAEVVEVAEMERIGRLVERVDNMKKNAVGNGNTQCVLCGDEFGLLGASPTYCEDCRKAVCSKCGVDTSNSQHQPIWLCKICSENRELWKRSGAWFFKGIPKYVIPTNRGKKMDGLGPGQYGKNRQDVKPHRAAAGRSYHTWSKGDKSYGESSDQDTSESSDDDVSIIKRKSKSTPEPATDTDSSSLGAPRSHPLSAGRTRHPENTRSITSTITTTTNDQEYDADSDFSQYSRDESSETQSLQSRRRGSQESREYNNDSYDTRSHGGISHHESLESRDLAEYGVTFKRGESRESQDTRLDQLAINPRLDKVSDADSHSSSSVLSIDSAFRQTDNVINLDANQPTDSNTLGSLEFSLLYKPVMNALHCTIHRAKGLKAMDTNGLSDPYVKLHLLPGASKSYKLRTKTIQKTLNPDWKETLTYHGITDEDMAKRTLRLTVLDEDTIGYDFIGETRVPLSDINAEQTQNFNTVLEKLQPTERETESMSEERGRILLSLCYSLEQKQLVVGVVRCAGLAAMDSNGYSDPYVKLYLKPDKDKKTKYKTQIKKKTLNPEFNQEFKYKLSQTELSSKALEVTVWDYDIGKQNDYIGVVQVGMTGKQDAQKHWLDMLRKPNQTHLLWHSLGEGDFTEE